MKEETETKASEGMTEQTEEEAEAEAMHDEETQKLRDAAQALQDRFSQGGSGTSSKQINMGKNENIDDKYGFQSTAANDGAGEGSDEDDQAASGILNVYKENKDAEDEEVDEEINTDDIKYKTQEE